MKRQDFANWILVQMKYDPDWLLNVLWTDESHFSLSVNTQNCRIWAREKIHSIVEKLLHNIKLTVWCGFYFIHHRSFFLRENYMVTDFKQFLSHRR